MGRRAAEVPGARTPESDGLGSLSVCTIEVKDGEVNCYITYVPKSHRTSVFLPHAVPGSTTAGVAMLQARIQGPGLWSLQHRQVLIWLSVAASHTIPNLGA